MFRPVRRSEGGGTDFTPPVGEGEGLHGNEAMASPRKTCQACFNIKLLYPFTRDDITMGWLFNFGGSHWSSGRFSEVITCSFRALGGSFPGSAGGEAHSKVIHFFEIIAALQ
ncbi:MAG: hypothetical protein ACJA16_004589 [Akkermansiaceae bacterium]